MSTVLLSYADGPRVYALNQHALTASARRNGIDRIEASTRPPPDDPFRTANCAILAGPQGGGYWLRKPRIILEALKRTADDDAGAAVRRRLDPLVAAARQHEGVLFWNDYPNWMHVKRDCFALAQSRLGEARIVAAQVWDHLCRHGGAGLENAGHLYRGCSEIFDAAGRIDESRAVATAGLHHVLRAAPNLKNPEFRRSFLDDDPHNRALVEWRERFGITTA